MLLKYLGLLKKNGSFVGLCCILNNNLQNPNALLPASEPLSVHLLYTCLSASFFYETDKAVTFWLIRGGVSHLLINYENSHFKNQLWFLTTLQSEISPKGANAFLKVSVSISGLRSPTKMWWWRLVSCLGVPPGEVAQFTWKAMQLRDSTTLFSVTAPSSLCPCKGACSLQ